VRRLVDGAKGHLFAASAARQQANADFDETGVELGMRPARVSMKGDLRAAPEAHAEGRDDHGLKRELDGLGHVLELADGHVDLVPLLFLNAHEQHHDVGADGEVGGVVGDDEGVEVIASAAGLEGLGDEGDDVATERVHLGVELDAADAVAEVDERGARVLLDHSVGFLGDGDGPDSGGNFLRLVVGGGDVEILAATGGLGVVGVPGRPARAEQLLNVGGDRTAFLLHALDGLGDAAGVPKLERAHLPVEAGLHRLVDFDDGVGDFGDAVGGVGPEIR